MHDDRDHPPVAVGQRARARPDRGRRGWVRRAPLLPALVFTIIITQLPFLLTLWYSLQSWSLVRPGSRHVAGLTNYVDVFKDSQFWTTALNTVIMTVGTVLIAMAIGVGLAPLLDRKFLGRGIVRTLLITPFLVMPVAGALVWKTVMLDPTAGRAESQPKDILEAASSDGARPLSIFRELTLPHLRR